MSPSHDLRQLDFFAHLLWLAWAIWKRSLFCCLFFFWNPTQRCGDYCINHYKDPVINQPGFHGSSIRQFFHFFCVPELSLTSWQSEVTTFTNTRNNLSISVNFFLLSSSEFLGAKELVISVSYEEVGNVSDSEIKDSEMLSRWADEPRKIPWSVGLYRGLYYPII